MTTSVQSLASWLLERITEDEAAVKAVDSHDWSELRYMAPGYTLARVLAECEAKRRIVELHEPTLSHPIAALDADGATVDLSEFDVIVRTRHVCLTCNGIPEAPCDTLRLLALPYADREGYREEWAL